MTVYSLVIINKKKSPFFDHLWFNKKMQKSHLFDCIRFDNTQHHHLFDRAWLNKKQENPIYLTIYSLIREKHKNPHLFDCLWFNKEI